MIVVDEYLAIRSLTGLLPADLPDEPLALTTSAHWRILQRIHGPGTGQLSQALAVSAVAAGVLAEEAEIPTETVAKFLHDANRNGNPTGGLGAGEVVVVERRNQPREPHRRSATGPLPQDQTLSTRPLPSGLESSFEVGPEVTQ